MTAVAIDLPQLATPELCSDEALARRACSGDDTAYAVIYARYHARIEAYCRAIVRHDEDARDAAQTAMTKAFVALRSQRGTTHLRPWLFRIAHNEALTVLRRRRHHHELTEALEGRDADPVIEVLLREQLRAMLDALATLPASHRKALLLRELGGLDYDTVAAVVGLTPRAARQAVFRARTMLRSERSAAVDAQCPEIRRVLAAHDGRRRRARKVRAHLRTCSACREWDAARPHGGALSALPAVLASVASSLWSWIGGAAAGSPGTVGAAAAAKVVAGVAVIAASTTPIAQREIHHVVRPAAAKRERATTAARATTKARAARPAAAASDPAPATRLAAATPPRAGVTPGPSAVSPRAAAPSRPASAVSPRAAAPSRPASAVSRRAAAPSRPAARRRSAARPGSASEPGRQPATHDPASANVRGVGIGVIRDGRSRPAAVAPPAR